VGQQPRDARTPAPKPEHRKEPRHLIDASAVLYLVGMGSKMHGRVLDLSLGGCCICTNERFPLGIFRRVETEFHLQGLAFRLAGVTQSIHDRRLVGVRFLDVSERKRAQLAQLIKEIQEQVSENNLGDHAGG
jgi:c-di-GMP-binding flagellar brake protein YcgR